MPASSFHKTSLITLADYEGIFRQLHENGYFTNHGPLAQEFEATLESFLQIDHVVAVGNESLAMLLALASLELQGDIVIPALGGDQMTEIAKRLGLRVRNCDVDPKSHQASVRTIQPVIDDKVAAVCVVEMYGNRCDPDVVDWLCRQGKHVVISAIDSFASQSQAGRVVSHPRVVTVLGFGPEAILSTTQGGAVATASEEVAERCRNIRSSYGARRSVSVTATCNGRFSEFQAGVGLINFRYLDRSIQRNRAIAKLYSAAVAESINISAFQFSQTTVANGQWYPIIVDTNSRGMLAKKMESIGVDLPKGKPFSSRYPIASELARGVTFLPVNNDAAAGLAETIADAIRSIT